MLDKKNKRTPRERAKQRCANKTCIQAVQDYWLGRWYCTSCFSVVSRTRMSHDDNQGN